ncbi:MAG: DUF2845 domain-containing protein [Thiohalocapsa sp.]
MRRASAVQCLLCCLLLGAAPAYALRCGNNVVSEGDSTLLLLRHCGEPTLKEQVVDRVPVRAYDQFRDEYYLLYEEQSYDVWTFNFGPRRFVQRITIKGGKIYRIESQGYGY